MSIKTELTEYTKIKLTTTTLMTFTLPDFERHDDDELGFRKNDIITIISQRDEHCWIGELNGLRGQFLIYSTYLYWEWFSYLKYALCN